MVENEGRATSKLRISLIGLAMSFSLRTQLFHIGLLSLTDDNRNYTARLSKQQKASLGSKVDLDMCFCGVLTSP